ncbi:hypothetical protein PLO_1088 [Pediococcus acidilactici NGRI 0510Q]|jgi:hypothetical protein|uniref:Uncharacterized protein n=2 Tax=Pediococcus acidilactici TaxID=1254 RepID=A0AAP3XB70_PEDAC|nr:hypothetical protein [Pediococcus acidilactici]GAC45616.1 hypothetical protein PLO_1088 [Pediococcus acidilactici NGRI 0510Q]APR29228.1 hypothetical protein BTW26_09530 [Pediococcus acidilactici]KRN90823.1 hypothetical protein IV82_GL001443 [Pediococcus acidilactici]MDD9324453.1 hypothetical protein [Pediococcus acidilactici]MDV2620825.1 hypothetical protein [Pediococcus acidilactici]
MKLNSKLMEASISWKEALEGDLIHDESQATKNLLVNNPEDPYNSESRTETDLRMSNLITNIKSMNLPVRKARYRSTNYPVVFDETSGTAILFFKDATIKMAQKAPDHFIWHACSAINGVAGDWNYLGQKNLFSSSIERLEDPKDGNIVTKLLGEWADKTKQLLVFCYEEQHGVVISFIREYDGLGRIIDEIKVEKPVVALGSGKSTDGNLDQNNEGDVPLKLRVSEGQNNN